MFGAENRSMSGAGEGNQAAEIGDPAVANLLRFTAL